jgi:tRNA G18 (ribose-2'-O)-methylase SpoU
VGGRGVKATRPALGAIRHKFTQEGSTSKGRTYVPIIRIEDTSDPRLADYKAVSVPELAAGNGIFIAEGRLVVRRLLAESRFTARSVLVTEAPLAALADILEGRPALPVFVAPQPVMNAITGFDIHRGCLAIGERPAPTRWQDLAAIANHKSQIANVLVCLERVANADNVGGVFRSAAAFGASAVLLDPASTDPLYRKAIRTSMGAALQVPFARADPWPAALAELRGLGFAVIAMTPAPGARPLRDVADSVAGRPIAIVLGHEGDGLTADALAACEFHARIPVESGVDSLNVAAAATIALYEFAGSASRNPAYTPSRGT